MGILRFFYKRNSRKITEFLKRDAVILDVRTQLEWEEVHLTDAINIPLSDLKDNIEHLKAMNKPIIAHCKSGVRSARAVKLLKFYNIEAVNGGGIADLQLLIT
ncbi:rhodanese-like domain-containing protein [Hyunsoonleella sp. SJ7]|uniref:Rhodanese-like domain-containing protein n=1 Tax=Hyunsoonleella aquatilis TaxID=2762758 RepID=A0A923HAZ0_9FLAO|nr:rhodanese-like domain-containing protein [Hyunsoonleella aquatilis]